MHAPSSAALGLLLAGLLPAQGVNAPCFESNLGTSLGNGDDVVFNAVNLGFTFAYAGANWTQVRVGTNGLVYLGNPAAPPSGCCSGTGAGLLAGLPQISILWTDLNALAPGAVWFNAVAATATAPARAVITWNNIVEYSMNARFTLQLQLVDGGGITMWYGPGTTITGAGHTMVAGVSPGNNATDPGNLDISASMPFVSTLPSVYEQWAPNAFDLAARSIEWLPIGSGNYLLLERTGCQMVVGSFQGVGTGCPAAQGNPNSEFYQLTNGAGLNLTNFGLDVLPTSSIGYMVSANATPWVTPQNPITMGDDQTIQIALPFPFPRPGGVTNTVGLCSNGYLWLDNTSTGVSYTPTAATFLSQGATFCSMWTDLNPGAGGQVFCDTNPAHALFTWQNVPEFAAAGNLNTMQVQLYANGRITVRYQSVTISAARNILTGFSRGGGVPDPGNTVLPTAVPFNVGTGIVPMSLVQASGNPVIGATYNLLVGSEPQSSMGLFLIMGLTPMATDLTPLGMPGCTQYQSLDSTRFVVATPPTQQVPIVIPNAANLIGVTARAQVAAFAPGINALGVVATNGGIIRVGTY